MLAVAFGVNVPSTEHVQAAGIKQLEKQLEILCANPPLVDEKDKYLDWERAVNEVEGELAAQRDLIDAVDVAAGGAVLPVQEQQEQEQQEQEQQEQELEQEQKEQQVGEELATQRDLIDAVDVAAGGTVLPVEEQQEQEQQEQQEQEQQEQQEQKQERQEQQQADQVRQLLLLQQVLLVRFELGRASRKC
jgi:hypothetical protein